MKRFSLPLFWKFTIALTGIVTIFGTVNVVLIWREVYEPLGQELESRGLFIARNLASQAVAPMLYDDVVTLQKLIDNVREIDSTIEYIFILNGGKEVTAHSFQDAVPPALIAANTVLPGKETNIRSIIPSERRDYVIRDMAVPILDGRIGAVRIGLAEKPIRDKVQETINIFFLMVGAFLTIGIAGAFVFA